MTIRKQIDLFKIFKNKKKKILKFITFFFRSKFYNNIYSIYLHSI
jgi:hypothetical protein